MSTSEFPLHRLPSLAIDEVIRVMDPLEQLALCQTSQKLQRSVRRLTKKNAFDITGTEDSIVFGIGPEKSSIITICEDSPLEGTWNYMIPSICYKNEENAVEAVVMAIKNNFAPTNFRLHLPRNVAHLYHFKNRTDAWNIMCSMIRSNGGFDYMFTNNREIPKRDVNDRYTYLSITDATWVTYEELLKLCSYNHVRLTQTAFTNVQLSQFCVNFIEKWANGETKTRELELGTSGRIQLEVAAGKLVDGKSVNNHKVRFFFPTTCYVVEGAGRTKVYMCSKDNHFILYVA